MNKLKLFPLGLVAYPTKIVPLHIFEERYKALINECISLKQEFGMVYSMDNGLADFGCSLSVSEIIKTYQNGEMDIITKGQRIFKIHSNIIENELTVGQVEFQDDKNESFGNQFDKLKEKYLKLLLQLGVTDQIERHMNKTRSVSYTHLTMPTKRIV